MSDEPSDTLPHLTAIQDLVARPDIGRVVTIEVGRFDSFVLGPGQTGTFRALCPMAGRIATLGLHPASGIFVVRMLLDEQEVFDNGVGIPTKIFESAMPPIAVRAEQVFAMQLRNLTGKRTTFSGAFCVYADSDSKTNPFLSLREMYS